MNENNKHRDERHRNEHDNDQNNHVDNVEFANEFLDGFDQDHNKDSHENFRKRNKDNK